MHTGQSNPLFHTLEDLVNRVVARQTVDWLVPSSQFSPIEEKVPSVVTPDKFPVESTLSHIRVFP